MVIETPPKKKQTPPSSDEERKKNIQEKIEQARQASPSQTLGGATGQAGVKGSYQATGGGTTQIVVDKGTGKSYIVGYSDVQTQPGEQPTTRGEFIESLMQRQEDLRGSDRKVYVSPSGDVIINTPSTATVNMRLAQELAASKKPKPRKGITVYTNTAETRYGTQIQQVAVPRDETSKKVQFEKLTPEEKKEYLYNTLRSRNIIKDVEHKPQGWWERIKNKATIEYSKLDSFLKSKIEKVIPEKLPIVYAATTPVLGKPLGKYQVEYEAGYIQGLRDKPAKTVAMTGLFFVLPPVLKMGGRVVGATKATAFLWEVVEPSVQGLIVGSYAKSIKERAMKSERPAMTLGEISSTEITPMIVGGAAGSYVWPRVTGFFRTLGRKKIPTEELVPPEVLSGKENFPTAPPSKQAKLFEQNINRLPEQGEKPIMFHAAPQPVKDMTIGQGSSELPGLYGSSDISAYFLKLGNKGQEYIYGGGLLEPYSAPQVLAITPTSFKVNPAYKTPTGWKFSKPTELGRADIPLMKTEIEAVLPPETKLAGTAKRYFFTYKGARVPIDEFSAVGEGTAQAGTVNFADISPSYSMGRSYVITPGSFLGGLISSKIKPSMSSTTPSRNIVTSSYKYKPPSISSYYTPPRSYVSSGISERLSTLSSVVSRSSNVRSYGSSSISSASSVVSQSASKISKSLSQLSKSVSSVSKTSSSRSSKSNLNNITETVNYPTPKFRRPGKPIIPAYTVSIKKGKSFLTIGKGLSYGRALQLGSKETLRTLRATFKVEQEGLTSMKDISFRPETRFFREYRISKGRRIETPDIFIQRRGTRLTTGTERKELQSYRKKLRRVFVGG